MATTDTEYRTFIIEYDDPYASGERWGVNLQAESYADAQRRLLSIRNTGVIMAGSFPMDDRWAHQTRTYIAQCPESKKVKIGKTRQDVKSRLMQMQTPAPLEVLSVIECDIEHDLHEIYKEYRTHGEYFSPVILETLATEIDRLLDKIAEKVGS